MAKSVDDRVVAMRFENAQFEAGVKQSMNTLEKLKASLHLPGAVKGLDDVAKSSNRLKDSLKFGGATKGLQDIQTAGKNVQLGHIARGVEDIKQRFSTLGVVGTAALATIASKAAIAGANIVKSLTISPVTGGLREYETQLNAVQTILSNTQAAGTTLKDVNAALQELNHYSDKTIYNFSQMAKNIGTFTAAGVDLDTATASIKGIANLAALSGSNAEQASTAMYQLSQAISAGRVSLQDWNSVVNAGMGGTVFQRALAQTAEQMGTLSEGAVQLKGKMKNVTIEGKSFRESVMSGPGKDSWLTSDVLTTTLKQFTGDLKDGELAAMGFNKAQIKSIQATAKTAQEAATKVKTLSQLFSTAKETAESGWAATWQTIFGDFGEARTLFTGASNALNGLITNSANARNKVLKDWKQLGGRTDLIASIKNVFVALGSVLKPIKEAFRDIFPATTGQRLYYLTAKLREFTATLKIGPETAENLKRTFRGLFAVLDIGKQIISGVFHMFTKLLGAAGKGSGGFLEFTGSIGDFLVSIDQALKKGDGLANVFSSLGSVLAIPIKLISSLATALGGLFEGTGSGGAEGITKGLNGLDKALQSVINLFQDLGSAIAEALGQSDFNGVLDVIRTVLLGGIAVMIAKFIKGGFSGGFFDAVTAPFLQLTATLKTMQQQVKAKMLLEIAAAIALLTASVLVLSKINAKDLAKALAAMAVGFTQLIGAMTILTKMGGFKAFAGLPFAATGLILLAGAVTVLSLAVKVLSSMSWEELAKGLGGVAVLLGTISAAAIPLSANSKGLITAGVGVLAISVALNVLAQAVKTFGKMDWATIGKGLFGVAAALVAVGVAMMFVPPNIALTGVGLIAVAAGLKLLGGAIKTFGNLDLIKTAKGLGIMVAAIVALGVAAMALPKTLVLQAAGLMLLSVALAGIAASIGLMGSMSLKTLAKGLGSLAGALIILAAGLVAMQGGLGGAAALVVAAAALALLVPPLVLLGQQSIGSIVKGLASLAGVFVVLGAAGMLIGPLAPAILALGGAMLVVGAAMVLFGGGVALLGAGLSALAVSGSAGIAILIRSLLEIGKVLPVIAIQFAKGILALVQTLAKNAPAFAVAMGQLLVALANSIIIAAPKLAQAFVVMVSSALTAMSVLIPKFITIGLQLLNNLLLGISQNIGRITTQVANIIIAFMSALTTKLPQLVSAGAKLLIAFLQGLTQNMAGVIKAAANAVAKFLSELARNASKVITAGSKLILKLVEGLGKHAGDLAAAGLTAVGRFATGIGKGLNKLITAGTNMLMSVIAGIGKNSARLVVAAMDTLLKFLQAVQDAVGVYAPQITKACVGIGVAMVQGVADGLVGLAGTLANKLLSPIESAIGKAKSLLKSNSPSKVFIGIGESVVDGLAIGLQRKAKIIPNIVNLSQEVIDAFKTAFKINKGSALITEELGKFLADGLVKGLHGSVEDIDAAFLELNDQVLGTMTKFEDEIDRLQELRRDYRAKKQEDRTKTERKAFNDAGDSITKYRSAIKQLATDRKTMAASQDVNVGKLKAEITKYDEVKAKIEEYENALKSLRDAKESAAKSFTDQYSILPEISSSDPEKPFNITGYLTDLRTQAAAVERYRVTLEKLKAMGIDDATYNKLVAEGTKGQEFADQLLAGGPELINALNLLDSQIITSATDLGSHAAANMYDAGIAAVEALKKPLDDSLPGIKESMERIADEMIKAIKKKLKIKSPSKVFDEIGRFSSKGLAQGLSNSTKIVTVAAEQLGDNALGALQTSMSAISDILTNDIDTNPVITPVLDLSSIRVGAKTLAELTGVTPIDATASYQQASAISVAQADLLAQAVKEASVTKEIKFEQNNYSPEALSPAEIYRQTNNQLARAKTLLTT